MTYCAEVQKFYKNKLNRKCEIINLDPANDNVDYKPAVDIMELVSISVVMMDLNVGPNGALMYCTEYLGENYNWLPIKLRTIKDSYLIFVMPGQVELYTHHGPIKTIFGKLQDIGYHLCVVHMVDSHIFSDPTKFISTLLLSLSTVLQIGLPQVKVLSKADILKKHSESLDLGLDFYTDVLNLEYLLELLNEGAFSSKFKKLHAPIVGLIQDYTLVGFIPVNVRSERSLLAVKNAVDKANGYVYGGGEELSIQALMSCAIGACTENERVDTDYV
ncbi:hypothetical protein RI129_011479 [Pyrocoelia pectoralis]|uniref:GPN-loop GTPase 2 n=1 Tax=Pyrocoelia pectoralis TaxID=417401 RepID=A0AAN7V803_9COLE